MFLDKIKIPVTTLTAFIFIASATWFFSWNSYAQKESSSLPEILVTAEPLPRAIGPVKLEENGKFVNRVSDTETSPEEVLNKSGFFQSTNVGDRSDFFSFIPPTGLSASTLLFFIEGFPIFDAAGAGTAFELLPWAPGSQTGYTTPLYPRFSTQPSLIGGSFDFEFPRDTDYRQFHQVEFGSQEAIQINSVLIDEHRSWGARLFSTEGNLPFKDPESGDDEKLPNLQDNIGSFFTSKRDPKGGERDFILLTIGDRENIFMPLSSASRSDQNDFWIAGGKRFVVNDLAVDWSGTAKRIDTERVSSESRLDSFSNYIALHNNPTDDQATEELRWRFDHRYLHYDIKTQLSEGYHILGAALHKKLWKIKDHHQIDGFIRGEVELSESSETEGFSAGLSYQGPDLLKGKQSLKPIVGLSLLHQFPSIIARYGLPPSTLANPDLQPQRTGSASLGVSWEGATFEGSLMGFLSESPNIHQYADQGSFYQYQDVNDVSIRGISSIQTLKLHKDHRIDSNITWLGTRQAKIADTITYKSEWNAFHAWVANWGKSWESSLQYNYKSSYKNSSTSVAGEHHIFSGRLTKSFGREWKGFLKVDNLLNEALEYSPDTPLPGRLYWVGAQVKF
jgi:hypothetical protein